MLEPPIPSCLHRWTLQHALLPDHLPVVQLLDLLADHWRCAHSSQAFTCPTTMVYSVYGNDSTACVGVTTQSAFRYSSVCSNSKISPANCQEQQKTIQTVQILPEETSKASTPSSLSQLSQVPQGSSLSLCSSIHQFPGGKRTLKVQILQTNEWINQEIQLPPISLSLPIPI